MVRPGQTIILNVTVLLVALAASAGTATSGAVVVQPAAALAAASGHATLLRDGYVRLPGVLSGEEARRWASRAVAAARARAAACATGTAQVPCEPLPPRGAPSSFLRARALSELRPITHAGALARIVAAVMNVSALRLYAASAFIKRPGDGRSRWHADAAAMPLRSDRIATLWLALDDLPATAGPLVFLNGSHLPGVPLPSMRGLAPRERVSTMRDCSSSEAERATGLMVSKPEAMQAGDATIHLGWTLHTAAANTAARDRTVVAVTYFADGARVDPALLEQVPHGEHGHSRAVRFVGEDGLDLLVHLLSDDQPTWEPWLYARPPALIPGVPVRHDELTPLVYSSRSKGW